MRARGAGAARKTGRAIWRQHACAFAGQSAGAGAGAHAMKLRIVLFVAASLLLAALSLGIGPSFAGPTRDFVLFELRLPRLLVGALVGATLSISGAAFQAVFNNAL